MRIQARCDRIVGAVPPIWWPSAMQGNGVPPALDQYQAISGPHGLTRLLAPFGSAPSGTDMSQATDLADYQAYVQRHFAQSSVLEALTRGTCDFEINGCPRFLSSKSSDLTVLPGSGWFAYRAAAPADLSPGGAFETAMRWLVDYVMNTLGVPSPRNPTTGKVEIGRPGILFSLFNEPNGESQFWGYQGSATIQEYYLCFERLSVGAHAVNSQAVCAGPVVAGYEIPRGDVIYASTSADLFSFARFVGGTEATGRRDANETRSYFTFPTTRLAPRPIASVSWTNFNIAASGDLSAATFDLRPYNTNGQGDPASDSTANAFTRAGSGTAYVSGYTGWRTTGGKTIDLGAQAAADLAAATTAGSSWSIGCTMPGASAGADRYANPAGFDNGSGVSVWPRLLVTYSDSILEQLIQFCGARGVQLDCLIAHSFQSDPATGAALARADIDAALAAAGLDPEMPYILTEYQHSDPIGAPRLRDDWRAAAFTLSILHANWQARTNAMCQVLLKLGSAPTDSTLYDDPLDEKWGMITKGFVNGRYIPTPAFMALRLLSLWSSGYELELYQEGQFGVRSFAAQAPDGSIVVMAARWDPGAQPVTLDLSLLSPPGFVDHIDLTQFTLTQNNPKHVYETAPGTDSERASAAAAAGAASVATTLPGPAASLSLGPQDSLFAQFFLRFPSPTRDLEPPPHRRSRNLRMW